MRVVSCLVLILVLGTLTFAAPRVSLTVYSKDLAVVRDVRALNFPKGIGEISVTDISARVDPTTVHLVADGITLLEQNYDYDLVSPERLAQKYIGHDIEFASKSGAITQGTLLSVSSFGRDNSQILVKQSDGSIRSMLLDDAAEIRYPKMPDGLIMLPTLRWKVRSAAEITREAEITYATGGMSWYADYVLALDTTANKGSLSGWVSVYNDCGMDFNDAEVQLVAGEIHRVAGPRQMLSEDRTVTVGMANLMDTRPPEEKSLFEYHLYTLPDHTDLANRQTKQITLFPGATTKISKRYEFDAQRDKDNPAVFVEFENREADGLGMPLPAGRVRVFQRTPEGGQEFVGEDYIKHTPKNEHAAVRVGKAFDVVVEVIPVDMVSSKTGEAIRHYGFKLRNHKPQTVEVTVVSQITESMTTSPNSQWEIIRPSNKIENISSQKIKSVITLEPEHEVIFSYDVRCWSH